MRIAILCPKWTIDRTKFRIIFIKMIFLKQTVLMEWFNLKDQGGHVQLTWWANVDSGSEIYWVSVFDPFHFYYVKIDIALNKFDWTGPRGLDYCRCVDVNQ